MGTDQFIKSLDLEQLRYARDKAEERIKEIESEKKIAIIIVENSLSNDSCFLECDFEKAKVRLCELIMKDDFEDYHLKHKEQPKLTRKVIFESELGSWMSLNERFGHKKSK